VNKKDLEILERNKSRLRELFEHLESLSIRSRDDISSGGCIIETDAGIVDAQIERRWDILAQALEKKPKSP
jgi:type III secretion protein L